MSTVHRAFDPEGNRFCAIKRMKSAHEDDLRWKESFNREYAALSDLSGHPNIVGLYDAGVDESGFYLVLEWLPGNLHDWVKQNGAMPWLEFYRAIGRPVLEALAFAQGRGWIHRDIKPQNVLMTEDARPKVSDYGIAKRFEKPVLGLTFGGFRSVPFTPPEDNSGEWGCSRDCFSFAAVAIFCLTAKVPTDYGSLEALAAGLNTTDVPGSILESALSHDPSLRPPLASAFLAELDAFISRREGATRPEADCHLQFEPYCIDRVMRTLDAADRGDVEREIANELNEVACGFRAIDSVDRTQRLVRIFAVTWIFEASLPNGGYRLIVKRAWQTRIAEIERQREAAYRAQLRFSFENPKDPVKAGHNLDDLLTEIDAFEAEERDRKAAWQRDRIFRLWYAFLRAKGDFEARRENAIAFTDFKINDARVAFVTELPAPIEIVGQSRVIRMTSGGHVFCDIVDVNLEEVVVVVTSGDSARIPRRGRLQVNTVAAEKSIERQRRALDAVNYDRAASPRLKTLILDPVSCQAPTPMAIPEGLGGRPFDPEKMDILCRALGVQDVLAIQGPPGTGKTRLIEEILVQYLARHPRHRVLLSSQTHVALDNVIERVAVRQPTIDIVRIGRVDDPKISPACRELVLDRKVQAWSDRVREKAQGYMARWAEDHGISRSDIEVGMLVERLILLQQRINSVKLSLAEAEQRVRAVEERAEAKLTDTGSADSLELDTASIEAQQGATVFRTILARVRSEIGDVRGQLNEAGDYGVELASCDDETELREWSKFLLGDGENQLQCRALLELQQEWALRVGRSSDFHAAMLASAQVVAGTCIGMAGVRGIGEVVYDLCIVDEASKATVTEILVPMARSRKWILVGDPEQLPPFFEDESITRLEEFEEEEVRQTLLDRFLRSLPAHSRAALTNQYRMVKPIGDLISEVFYGGELKSPKLRPDVLLTGVCPKPVTWLSTSEASDAYEVRRGQSFSNDAECRIIRDLLGKIDFIARKRRAIYDVVVIAGYMAQVKALQDSLRDRLHEWSGLKITCSTVDAFQGSEAEICIYSVTRSNREGRLGFLRERPRLNVALSRGRSALIIVGDDAFCRTATGENPFRKVLDFIETHPDECDRRRVQ